MKQYYYSDGQQQLGPLSKEELQSKGITKETLVWYEGLSEWTKAGELEDLADLFPNIPTPPPMPEQKIATPPPIPETEKTMSSPVSPEYETLEGKEEEDSPKNTRKIIFICMGIVIVIIVAVMAFNESQHSYSDYPKTESELRAELKMNEQNNPLKYLSDDEVYLQKDVKMFKQTYKGTITGYIVNNATMAKYKDVEVEVVYYSQTETEIRKESYVIYNYYEPNSKKKFTLNVTYPKAYHSFGLRIIGATPVYE